MTEEDKKSLIADTDGLVCYEYLANNIDICYDDMDMIVECMARADLKGQFTASAARYLHAIDSDKYADVVNKLVELTIERDREHAYLADLLVSLYGTDYASRAEYLTNTDNNFRRIYKRLYPSPESL